MSLHPIFRNLLAPIRAQVGSPETLEKAVRDAFHSMPSRFHASDFVDRVNQIYYSNSHAGTILRDLRRARGQGKLNYKVIDHNKALYEKV